MASRWKAISRTLARQRFPERVHMDGNDRCEEERKQLRLQPSTDDRRPVYEAGRIGSLVWRKPNVPIDGLRR